MIIESVFPNPSTNVLSNGIPFIPPQLSVQSNAVNNNTSFASTFRARTLSSGCVDLDAIFDAAGQKYNLSPDLLKAVAKVESNFRPHVTSRAGAMGIMQLMPGTARYLGVDNAFDPEQNIMGGARYLREQLDRFDGDIELALAAYNAGWPAVKKHGGIPPFRETQAYVPKVLGHLGGGEITAGTLTYNGFSADGMYNVNNTLGEASGNNNSFDVNEMLAQMLFIKMIEMQMDLSSSSNSNNTGRIF